MNRLQLLRTAASVSCIAAALFTVAGAGAAERFSVSSDGLHVTDSTTGLTWKRCLEGMAWDGTVCKGKATKFTFVAARKYAAEQKADGGKTWRIPTKDELKGLVDTTQKKKPRIDKTVFPGTPSSMVWATRPEKDDNLNAWMVDFGNGKVFGNTGSKAPNLRLVHSTN